MQLFEDREIQAEGTASAQALRWEYEPEQGPWAIPLFTYIHSFDYLIQSHGFKHQLYTDDPQIETETCTTNCLLLHHRLMSSGHLKFGISKSELLNTIPQSSLVATSIHTSFCSFTSPIGSTKSCWFSINRSIFLTRLLLLYSSKPPLSPLGITRVAS